MRIRSVLLALVGTGIGVAICYLISEPIGRHITLEADSDFSAYRFFFVSDGMGKDQAVEWHRRDTGQFFKQYATSFEHLYNIRLVAVPRTAVEDSPKIAESIILRGELPHGSYCFPIGAHSKDVPFCDWRDSVTAQYRLTVESGELTITDLGVDQADWPGQIIAGVIGLSFFGLPLVLFDRYLRRVRAERPAGCHCETHIPTRQVV